MCAATHRRRRRVREMRLRSGLTGGPSADGRIKQVHVGHGRRGERGHVRRSGHRLSPVIWLAVPTRFPPALTCPHPPRLLSRVLSITPSVLPIRKPKFPVAHGEFSPFELAGGNAGRKNDNVVKRQRCHYYHMSA